MTGIKFPKQRPKVMKGLELDGFNTEDKIAFEYNGRQHYMFVPRFHRNGLIDFHMQQVRDAKKRRLCGENGIRLIVIPYTKRNKLYDFIKNELIILGVKVLG